MNLLQKTLLAVSAAFYLGSRLLCSQTTNSTLVCSGAENCNRCVQDPSCFWCETQLLCKVYGVKNEKNETKNCDDWNWKTCEKTDTPLLAIISGCTSLVLISGKFFFLFFFFFFMKLQWQVLLMRRSTSISSSKASLPTTPCIVPKFLSLFSSTPSASAQAFPPTPPFMVPRLLSLFRRFPLMHCYSDWLFLLQNQPPITVAPTEIKGTYCADTKNSRKLY